MEQRILPPPHSTRLVSTRKTPRRILRSPQDPTKRPLVALMKQARAFEVGVVVATRNPMDLDYRVLSDAGLRCLGRRTRTGPGLPRCSGVSTAKRAYWSVSVPAPFEYLARILVARARNSMAAW